jgi:CheY-like chemotaxis protein
VIALDTDKLHFSGTTRMETETRRRVLIVDDEAMIRTLLSNVLSTQYSVMTAENGLEALMLFESNRFDLLVTDLVMPQMNGVELIHRLRRYHADLPVLVMTGYTNVEVDRQVSFISKPFTIQDFKRKVEVTIASDCHSE